MEVILKERIEKLGQLGDIVNVKPGYARNFLLPQNKAVAATKENKEHFEKQRSSYEAVNIKQKKEADTIGKKLSGSCIVTVRQAGDGGQLYGSVNASDIANGVIEAGFNINRNQVSLERPIKSLGLHNIKIALHPEVAVTITANVARSLDEAEIQERTGEAIVSGDNEEVSLFDEAINEENSELELSDKSSNGEEQTLDDNNEPELAETNDSEKQ